MRMLLEKQLELIQGLSERMEHMKEGRNRHIEMLKMLSLHLSSLIARSADAPSEARSLSDNVRLLCERIAQGGAAENAEDVPTLEGGMPR